MKPQPLTKRQQQALQTKQHIYQVGLGLMEKKGYHGTTIEQISKAAKVSVGAFYHHFQSKEDILSQIYQDADAYFLNQVSQQLTAGSAPARIVEYFDRYAAYNVQVGVETMKVLYHAENRWFVKKHRGMQEVLLAIIEQGREDGQLSTDLSSEKIAEYLFISARGVVFNWCLLNGQYDLQAQMQDYMQRLVQAFCSLLK